MATIEQLRQVLSEIHDKPFALVSKDRLPILRAGSRGEQSNERAMAWPTMAAQYAWTAMSGGARITSPVNARYPSIVTTKARESLKQGK